MHHPLRSGLNLEYDLYKYINLYPLPFTDMKISATLDKVNKAFSKIQDVGTVQIDWSKWSFSVKWVEWRFSYDQDTEELQIVIDDKPWLASESMIENEIKKFFQS